MSKKTYSQKNPNTNVLQRIKALRAGITELNRTINEYEEDAKKGKRRLQSIPAICSLLPRGMIPTVITTHSHTTQER